MPFTCNNNNNNNKFSLRELFKLSAYIRHAEMKLYSLVPMEKSG